MFFLADFGRYHPVVANVEKDVLARLYIFQGPSVLMPPEADSKRLRKSKLRLEVQDMEASLLRARLEASRADGISWGMREDAVEEIEIMEELENLEETLNDSIWEIMGARAGSLSLGKRKGATEDEEEDYFSDDDDFYDRTRKSSKCKTAVDQSVETANSLLNKKDAIVKKMEDKRKLLLGKDKATESNEVGEVGDALDAYMSAVSSQLGVNSSPT